MEPFNKSSDSASHSVYLSKKEKSVPSWDVKTGQSGDVCVMFQKTLVQGDKKKGLAENVHVLILKHTT